MLGPAGAAELEATVNMPELSAAAEKIIITEGGVLDRPYRVPGQVFVRAKRIGVFDRPSIDEKVNILLKARAAELGADAVVNVRRERDGVSVFNFGYMNGIGAAVVFESSAPQRRPALAPPSALSAPNVAPAPTAPSIAAPPQSMPRIPLVVDPVERLTVFLSAMNSGNSAAAANLFASDVALEDPAGSQPLEGKGAIVSYLRALIGRGVRYELVMSIGNVRARTAAVALHVSMGGVTEDAIQTFTFRPNGTISKLLLYRAPPR